MRVAAPLGLVLALLALASCTPGAAPDLPPVGVAAVAAQRAACEARGGNFRALGASLSFCQSQTGDAGKACTSSRDCEGACLARSRSCAPLTPLPGCNEVLTSGGQVVTECLQ
ncbi:MAG: hypothetical protein K0B00_03680 [Rhodobacteraceae bacterium]|nr:hypothetical protein [Paracoccaceae bacterium]